MSRWHIQLPSGANFPFVTSVATEELKWPQKWFINLQDDQNIRERKTLVFVASIAMILCGSIWGILYICAGAYLACIFPALVVLIASLGLAHLVYKHHVQTARQLLCWSLCLCTIVGHVSFGGRSGAVINWSLLAPQLLLFMGSSEEVGALMLAIGVAAFTACHTAERFIASEDMRFHSAFLGDNLMLTFNIANGVLPWIFSFLLIRFMLSRLQTLHCQKVNLEKAEALARKIVDFNVDSLDDLEEVTGDAILDLLKHIAFNVRIYRPYIPVHIVAMASGEGGDIPLPDDSYCAQNGPLTSRSLASDSSCGKSLRGDPRVYEIRPTPLLTPLGPPGGSPVPRVAIRSIEVAHALRTGTLLYVKLHKLEAYVRHGPDSNKVERFRRSANLFAEIVMAAVKETRGVLQSMQHNVCLVGWNFISTCRTHAINACRAAIFIRDRIEAAERTEEYAPMALSVGLWTGTLVSGTFGSNDYKALGTVGYGVRRSHELQKYAVKHQHVIIANSEAQQQVSLNPCLRLVAVDVLDVEGVVGGNDPLNPGGYDGAELVYEVVEEISVEDNEWMYQYEKLKATRKHDTEDDLRIERLLLQARTGVTDMETFRNEVMALTLHSEHVICTVANRLRSLIKDNVLSQPYRMKLTNPWIRCVTLPASTRPKSLTSPLKMPFGGSFDSPTTDGFVADLSSPHPGVVLQSGSGNRRTSTFSRDFSPSSHCDPMSPMTSLPRWKCALALPDGQKVSLDPQIQGDPPQDEPPQPP